MKSNTLVEYHISGMDCPGCAATLTKSVEKLSGVTAVDVQFATTRMRVGYDPARCAPAAIEAAVRAAGYEAVPRETQTQQPAIEAATGETGRSSPEKPWLRHRRATILSGVLLLAGWLCEALLAEPLPGILLLGAAILVGGFAIARQGWREVRRLSLGIHFLMTIAVAGAVAIGELTEGAMVVFLFSLAEWLEAATLQRARKSISALVSSAPRTARVKTAGGSENVAVELVAVGQVVMIRPGERIPMDGDVLSGDSYVDQSQITGESTPVRKQVDAQVYAGSINQHGALEIRVSRPHSDSLLSRIIHLVEEAQQQKAPTQRFVDAFARYYTPAVVVLAVITALLPPLAWGASFTTWFYRALVLLVISCPCALVISTPVTIISGLTYAARRGILIKGGNFLETFGSLRACAFDKTGTLTIGRPQVTAVQALNHFSEEELLGIAASLEASSEHPVAAAVVEFCASRGVAPRPVSDFQALPGRGVCGRIDGRRFLLGNHRLLQEEGIAGQDGLAACGSSPATHQTTVWLADEHRLIGSLVIADVPRREAAAAVAELRSAGVHTLMLTGDNTHAAAAVAATTAVEEFRAELLPEEKLAEIQSLRRRYGKVAMVGDGINDAPALAAADVGVSLQAGGTDMALETADVILMNNDLRGLSLLRRLSRRARGIIQQNITVALGLKAVFLVLAIPGWATLWMAVFADMGASLIVVFNGLRALRLRASSGQSTAKDRWG